MFSRVVIHILWDWTQDQQDVKKVDPLHREEVVDCVHPRLAGAHGNGVLLARTPCSQYVDGDDVNPAPGVRKGRRRVDGQVQLQVQGVADAPSDDHGSGRPVAQKQ